MALIDIEYGSLASSETMNKNFLYLDDRISETSDTIMTSISSIYSNIATINARLSDIAEQISDMNTDFAKEITDLTTQMDDYKTRFQTALNTSGMAPNWSGVITLGTITNYTVPSNGYLLILPYTTGVGDLIVNGKNVLLKVRNNANDNASILTAIPVKKGDIATCTSTLEAAYFLPIKSIEIETN